MKPWKELLKTKKFWILTFIGVFLVVVVPIIINELYKVNKGYLTVWDGSDVLTYYGTILGAIATIWALSSTINFTRRQIRYDRFMQNELKRWQQIEELSNRAIEAVVPLKLNDLYANIVFKMPDIYSPAALVLYGVEARRACNAIICCLNENEKALLLPFITELENLCDEIVSLANQFDRIADGAQKALTENQPNTAKEYFKNLSQQSETLVEKVCSLQNNEYKRLLQSQRECFSEAYIAIDSEADKLL